MKYIQFTLIFIIGFIIASEAQNSSPLDTYSKIDKENIKQHSFDLKIQNDRTIDLMSMITSPVDGIAVTGKGTLFSDSSLIRIIASNENGDEFLVYEANCIFNDIGNIQFHNYQDETFLLNSFFPIKLKIQTVDAEVELKKLVFYNITTQEKAQKEERNKSIKKEIAQYKLLKVEEYISKNKMIWSTEINPFNSSLYKNKKLLYGEKYNSYGIEYYQDGFFSIPVSVSHREQSSLKSGSLYVNEFDWRNQHGQNWMTENKCQSGCWINGIIDCTYADHIEECENAGGEYRGTATCWAFATIGALEALTNLYFNQHIDYDLSEQQLVNCFHNNVTEGFNSVLALDSILILNSPIVDESCLPYTATSGNCNSICNDPVDRIKHTSHSNELRSIYVSEDDFKKYLIEKGPMPCRPYVNHQTVFVGYGVVKAGDFISYVIPNIIPEGSEYIGQTYWVSKQSSTFAAWSSNHVGYIYCLDRPLSIFPINVPIISEIFDGTDVVCIDNDNDGYYWWGLGEKPAHCTTCCSDEPDGDDSNPNLGPMDAYGNCMVLNAPLTCPYEITGNETWTTSISNCGGYLVKAGANLIINGATVIISSKSEFEVEVGATFTMNYGTIQTN